MKHEIEDLNAIMELQKEADLKPTFNSHCYLENIDEKITLVEQKLAEIKKPKSFNPEEEKRKRKGYYSLRKQSTNRDRVIDSKVICLKKIVTQEI